MPYNFLGLVNQVCNKMGEAPLTSGTFAAQNSGFYGDAKDSVNSAVRDINQMTHEWPFNHNTQNDTLVAGTARYALPATNKVVKWRTFRIRRNDTFGNQTVSLNHMDYTEYLRKYIDDEYNTATNIRNVPERVIRTPDDQYVMSPIPDQAYELDFEWYAIPTDLENATDVPSIPFQFRYVINHGANYYAYMYRGDTEAATLSLQRFKEGIGALERQYIPLDAYMRDDRIEYVNDYTTHIKVNN